MTHREQLVEARNDAERRCRAAEMDAARWRDAALYVAPMLAAMESDEGFDFDGWGHVITEARRLIAVAERFEVPS